MKTITFSKMFFSLTIAGLVSFLPYSAAQAVDWSKDITGRTLKGTTINLSLRCTVEDITNNIWSQWVMIKPTFSTPGTMGTNIRYFCYTETGIFGSTNGWKFNCLTLPDKRAGKTDDGIRFELTGAESGSIYLFPGKATQSATCAELYNTLKIGFQ